MSVYILELNLLDWFAELWQFPRSASSPFPKGSDSLWRDHLGANDSPYVTYVVHDCAATKPPKGRFIQSYTGWNDEQKRPRMQDCHLKITRDWQDRFRLISDLNAYWLWRRTKKLHKGIQTFTHVWAHYGNDVHPTVSPIVPKPVWTWPLTLPPDSLLIQRTRKGPYALCLHATHSQQRHGTRTDVPWLQPATHREAVLVGWQCWNIWVDPSLSILQIHYG